MKSPRKSTLLIYALVLVTPAVLIAARMPQDAPQPKATQPAPAPAGPRSQSTPPQSEAQAKISVNSSLVILPVTVKDRSGNLVPDLHRDEFRVFEDNVEQNIDLFTAEAFPLSLVVLIDNDLKDKDAQQVQASLDAIVAGLSVYDEADVCRFDEFFHAGPGFTADQDKLLAELHRTKLDSELGPSPGMGPFQEPTINGQAVTGGPAKAGSTIEIGRQTTKALDDAVYGAALALHDRGRSRRKVILLISDGANGGKKVNKNPYDVVVKTLLHDNISVYSIAVASAYLDRKFTRLISYAKDSGGDMYFAAKRESLETLYSQVTEEARNQYTLAYIPRGTDHNAEYHSIEVRVKREGLTIKTREGYYAGQIPGATPQ